MHRNRIRIFTLTNTPKYRNGVMRNGIFMKRNKGLKKCSAICIQNSQ